MKGNTAYLSEWSLGIQVGNPPKIARLLPEVPILMHTLHSTPGLELEAGKFGIRKVVSKSLVSAMTHTPASGPCPP